MPESYLNLSTSAVITSSFAGVGSSQSVSLGISLTVGLLPGSSSSEAFTVYYSCILNVFYY